MSSRKINCILREIEKITIILFLQPNEFEENKLYLERN